MLCEAADSPQKPSTEVLRVDSSNCAGPGRLPDAPAEAERVRRGPRFRFLRWMETIPHEGSRNGSLRNFKKFSKFRLWYEAFNLGSFIALLIA